MCCEGTKGVSGEGTKGVCCQRTEGECCEGTKGECGEETIGVQCEGTKRVDCEETERIHKATSALVWLLVMGGSRSHLLAIRSVSSVFSCVDLLSSSSVHS